MAHERRAGLWRSYSYVIHYIIVNSKRAVQTKWKHATVQIWFDCIYKCPISSQSIKYRYKFKSNQKKISQKILELISPSCVPSLKYLAQVFADICKCPIASQTIKYRYKFKSNQRKFPPKFLN